MFYTTDPVARERFITALRQLASYLASHPAVPVPTGTSRIILHADPAEDGGREQVNHIARLLGTPVDDRTRHGGHYTTVRTFGQVIDYEAASIPATWMAWHNAQDSYQGCITVDANS